MAPGHQVKKLLTLQDPCRTDPKASTSPAPPAGPRRDKHASRSPSPRAHRATTRNWSICLSMSGLCASHTLVSSLDWSRPSSSPARKKRGTVRPTESAKRPRSCRPGLSGPRVCLLRGLHGGRRATVRSHTPSCRCWGRRGGPSEPRSGCGTWMHTYTSTGVHIHADTGACAQTHAVGHTSTRWVFTSGNSAQWGWSDHLVLGGAAGRQVTLGGRQHP